MLCIANILDISAQFLSPSLGKSVIIDTYAMPISNWSREFVMRLLILGWICLVFTLAGCGSQCHTHSGDQAKSGNKECTECEQCSTPSRSAILSSGEENKESPAIALTKVKYDAFAKDIKAQNGKVVIAYQWASASGPSKKNLPMLIELQRKHAKEGLVCITASNDTKEAGKEALKHLNEINCGLVNYLQDENDTVDGWTSCFGCCGFPTLVIFGRDGKRAATYEVTELPFEAATIEKTLVKLLGASQK
jgi:hypothetical protein